MTSPCLHIQFSTGDASGFTIDLTRIQEIITLAGPFEDSWEPDGSFRLRSRKVHVVHPESFLEIPVDRPRKLVIFELEDRLHGLPVWSTRAIAR